MKKYIGLFIFGLFVLLFSSAVCLAGELIPAETIYASLMEKEETKKTSLNFQFRFDTGSDRLQETNTPQLREIGKAMVELKMNRYQVTLEGHTDNRGDTGYNLMLSKRRANAVKNYLLGLFELPFLEILTHGLGEARPMADNDLKAGRAQNRRVVLKIEETRELNATPEIFLSADHAGDIIDMKYSMDERFIVTSAKDQTIKIWDVKKGKPIRTIPAYNSIAVMFSPDGRFILSLESEKKTEVKSSPTVVRIRNANTGKEVRTIIPRPQGVYTRMGCSSDGRVAVIGGEHLFSFDIETGKPVWTLKGQGGKILCLDVSPDGQHLVTGEQDGSVRLWDLNKGQQIDVLGKYEHEHDDSKSVETVKFSQDGRYIVSCGEVSFNNFRDKVYAMLGKIMPEMKNNDEKLLKWMPVINENEKFWADTPYYLQKIDISLRTHPPFKDLFTAFELLDENAFQGVENGMIRLWDVEKTTEKKILKRLVYPLYGAEFSKNGKAILSFGLNGEIREWDLITGISKITKTGFEVRGRHSSYKPFSVLSPDQKKILKNLDGGMVIRDISTGDTVQFLQGNGTLVNIQSCEPILSPDRKVLAIPGQRNEVQLLDLKNGKITKKLQQPPMLWEFMKQAFPKIEMNDHLSRLFNTPHENVTVFKTVQSDMIGDCILFGFTDGTLLVIHADRDGKIIAIPKAHKGPVTAIAGSGSFLVSYGKDHQVIAWDMATGKRVFSWENSEILSLDISQDGQYLLAGQKDGKVTLQTFPKGENIRTILALEGPVNAVAFSSDRKHILTGGEDTLIKSWGIPSLKEIHTFKGHGGAITQILEDEGVIYSYSRDRQIRSWEVVSGKSIGKWNQELFSMRRIESNGLIAFDQNFKGISCNPESQKIKRKAWSGIQAMNFSSDGQWIAVTNEDPRTCLVYDLSDGRLVNRISIGPDDNIIEKLESLPKTFVKNNSSKRNPAASGYNPLPIDGQTALGKTENGFLLENTVTEEPLLNIYLFTDGEWVTMTPQGYYASSLKGDNYLNIRIGNGVFELGDFRRQFYRPDVVEETIALQSAVAAIDKHIRKRDQMTTASADKIAPPVITILGPKNDLTTRKTDIPLEFIIKDYNHPIQSFTIHLNGYQLKDRSVEREKSSDQNRIENLMSIPLKTGENILRIVASNAYSRSEKTIRITRHTETGENQQAERPKPLHNLWLLAVGVSKYDHLSAKLQLDYADDDANAFADAFKKLEGRLFKKVNTLVLADGSPLPPTRDNIVDNMDFVSQASQYDTVILFVAGHGLRDAQRNFYFLPKDAKLKENGILKKSSGIRYSQLTEFLGLPSHTLFFIDTCHAGGVTGVKTRAIDGNDLMKSLQDTGALVFSSSRGNEFSQESEKWGHGLFTYAILEGLKGKADLFKETPITMKELDIYVSQMVSKYSGGAQHPITYIPNGYGDFVLYMNE